MSFMQTEEFAQVSLLTDFRSWSEGLEPSDCDEETIDAFLGHDSYEGWQSVPTQPTPWTAKEIAQKAWLMAGCPTTGHKLTGFDS